MATAANGRGSIWLRRAGLVVGILLLVAAIAYVVMQQDMLVQAQAAISQHAPGELAVQLAILAATVLSNIILSGLMYSILISRYGRVGLMEMQALIAAATLLNFLPMRAGLIGRVAYHKAVNRIPLRDGAKTAVQGAAVSMVTAGYLAIAVMGARLLAVDLWLLVLLPLPALAAGALVARTWRRYVLAVGVRSLEVLITAARYAVAFALIGVPIDSRSALAFACIAMIATMVPLLSNGLGLREWAVGLVAPLVTAHHMDLGITADLVNRAAEVIVVLPAGLAGLALLAQRRTYAAACPGEENPAPSRERAQAD